MSTITLLIEEIEILTKVQKKLSERKQLSAKEQSALSNFLVGLPSVESLLLEKVPFNDALEIRLMDMRKMWSHLEKWISLFNKLPKETSFTGTHAWWIDAEADRTLWQSNIIIVVSFIPSLTYSQETDRKSFYLHLKTDGTAYFDLTSFKDAAMFPELYHFKGTWKESYLMTIKTLQTGWPQTKFPEELLPLLKK